jgi:hypothetical protein
MRLAVPLVALALAAASLAGCGSSSDTTGGSSAATAPVGASARTCATRAAGAESLRATGVSCGLARRVMYGWQRRGSCAAPAGASRSACTSRSYRCLGARTDRGVAVSCSRRGRSIAFLARRG